MAEQHSIGFVVDASRGESGAKKFKNAIKGIGDAIVQLEKSSDKTFAKLDKGFDGAFFKKFNAAIRQFNNTKVSAASVRGMAELATVSKNFKSPSQVQTKNLAAFARTLSRIQAPRGAAGIAKLSMAVGSFRAPTPRQTKNLQGFVQALKGMKVPRNANAIAAALDRITTSAVRASTSLSGLRGTVSTLGLNKLTRQANTASKSMFQMGTSFNVAYQGGTILRNALGALTLGEFARSVFEASNAVQTFNVTMETVSGSASTARTDLAFVRQTANDLAIDLRTAQQQYAAFAAASNVAGLEAEKTRAVFKAVSTAMTVLNRSTQDQELSFLALQQMISKGTVSSEELRRQLGERLPGALEIMARALDVSGAELNKMLKTGSILSKDALPKFAKELETIFSSGVPAALERTSSQLRLLRNDFEAMFMDMGEAGFMMGLTDGVKDLREAVKSPEFKEFAKTLGEGIGDAISIAADMLAFMADNADTLTSAMRLFLELKLISFFKSMSGTMGLSAVSMAQMGRSARGAAAGLAMMSNASKASTLATATLTTTLRGLKLALGPVGVAFLAMEAAMLAYDKLVGSNERASASYANVLEQLGDSAESARVALERLSENQKNVLEFDINVSIPEADEKAIDAVKRLRGELETIAYESRTFVKAGSPWLFFMDSLSDVGEASREEFDRISLAFRKGEMSVDEFRDSLNAMAKADPRILEVAQELSEYIQKAVKAEQVTKTLASHQKELEASNRAFTDSLKDNAEAIDSVTKVTGTNQKLVEKYMNTLRQSSAPAKDLHANIQSLKQAFMDYNKEVAAQPKEDALKAKADQTELLVAQRKALSQIESELSNQLLQSATRSAVVKDMEDEFGASSREALLAREALGENESKIISLRTKQSKATEQITKTEQRLAQTNKDLSEATETYSERLKALNTDTKEYDRLVAQLASKALAKYAPKLANVALETEKMAEAQRTLNQLVMHKQLTEPEAAKALIEYGKKLKTAATAGYRAMETFEKIKGRLESSKVKKGLEGEDLARFNAVDRFKKDGEQISKDLDAALTANNQRNIELAKQAKAQYDKMVKETGDAAVAAFRKEQAEKDKKKKESDAAKYDRESARVANLIGRNNDLVKSKKELIELQKLSTITDDRKKAVTDLLGVSLEDYTKILEKAIDLKKKETEPGKVYLEQLQDEISLLTMSAKERRLITDMRSAEEALLTKGIDLKDADNEKLRQNIKLLIEQKDVLENPVGVDAFIHSIGTMEEAIQDLNKSIAEDLTDTFANFLITGKFAFKDFANSILREMANLISKQVFKMFFGAILKSVGGGVFDGIFGGITASAKGNAFVNGNMVTAFAKGGVVNQPTFFGANNGLNVAGEVPGESEGILPLKRMSNGDLGVQAEGSTGISGGSVFNYQPTFAIEVAGAGDSASGASDPGALDALGKQLDNAVNQKVTAILTRAIQPGGLLNKGAARTGRR